MERFALTVRLRLLPTAENGRQRPIRSDYRPMFDMGNRWQGEPMPNDGRIVLLDAESLAPGAECDARIDPLRPELWAGVRTGAVLPISEGTRVVGHATVLSINWPEEMARSILGFVTHVNEFCTLMNEAARLTLTERVQRSRRHLVALLAAGADLPTTGSGPDRPGPTHPMRRTPSGPTRGATRAPRDTPGPRMVTAKKATKKAATTSSKTSAKPPAKTAARPRVFAMSFASVYPLYVAKAEKKGRTKEEVDEVIAWLTGYRGARLQKAIDDRIDFETFFAKAPRMNAATSLVTGVVCGVRVEEVADPLMQKIRYLDLLVDELARGKKMASILRA